MAADILGRSAGHDRREVRRHKVDFLVVADLVMTPTAALADIVLPAASYLESDAVVVSRSGTGVFCLEPQQKVVQVGEACRISRS